MDYGVPHVGAGRSYPSLPSAWVGIWDHHCRRPGGGWGMETLSEGEGGQDTVQYPSADVTSNRRPKQRSWPSL